MRWRQEVASRYMDLLPAAIHSPFIASYNVSAFAQYTIQVPNRAAVQAALEKRGIPTAVHYPLGLHEQPIFKETFSQVTSFPNTEHAAEHVLSLPMHPYLSLEDQRHIVQVLTEILSDQQVD